MKKVNIEIKVKLGSKFQQQFARDSLMAMLKSWREFLRSRHKKNEVDIKINDLEIQYLEWFNFE